MPIKTTKASPSKLTNLKKSSNKKVPPKKKVSNENTVPTPSPTITAPTMPNHLIWMIVLAILITIMIAIYKFILPYEWSPQRPLLRGVPLSGEFDQSQAMGVFHGQTFPTIFQNPLADLLPQSNVLGYPSQKRIEVDLTNQRLYAFEGDTKIYDFLISSGKWGRTPTGTFNIWTKLRYTRMEGGNPALNTYYNLPNVPYTMFFANADVPAMRGFGIHGTYWHNNFGQPMSHGCVNMKTEEAGLLYYWAEPTLPEDKKSGRATQDNPGTTITIYGKSS